MYRGLKIVVIAPCLNEQRNIANVVRRVRGTELADEIVVVDDGSEDRSRELAAAEGATVLPLGRTIGVGAALRAGFEFARLKYDVIVVLGGNDKDEPKEIPRLLDPIAERRVVFVQGSRYLEGGTVAGGMPRYRRIATRLHPYLFSRFTKRQVTESTNGFRAFRVNLLGDPRIRLDQRWLDGYGLEPYLYYKAVALGYPCTEVPVTKTYPPRGERYTKMTPIADWWSILSPLFLLRFGLKK